MEDILFHYPFNIKIAFNRIYLLFRHYKSYENVPTPYNFNTFQGISNHDKRYTAS